MFFSNRKGTQSVSKYIVKIFLEADNIFWKFKLYKILSGFWIVDYAKILEILNSIYKSIKIVKLINLKRMIEINTKDFFKKIFGKLIYI